MPYEQPNAAARYQSELDASDELGIDPFYSPLPNVTHARGRGAFTRCGQMILRSTELVEDHRRTNLDPLAPTCPGCDGKIWLTTVRTLRRFSPFGRCGIRHFPMNEELYHYRTVGRLYRRGAFLFGWVIR